MCNLFRHLDFEVTAAATVSEGLSALDPPPDCVMLDLSLPDGCGETILTKIQSDRLGSRVVICTGNDDEERLERVRALGAAAILMKPLSLSDLVTASRVSAHLRAS